MFIKTAGFIFLLPVLAWGQTEPDPETYIPPFVEIREHAPAGVTDEWWMGIAKPLILHVTPPFETIPSYLDHESYEIIRSATTGFLIRSATGWDLWPEPLDDLRNRVKNLESTPVVVPDQTITINYQGNNVYWFSHTFTAEASTLFVPFPANKQLDTAISFLALIGGFQFNGDVRYGLGGRQDGMQFTLYEGTWLPGTEASGQFTLTDYTPWAVPVDEGGAEIVTPGTAPERYLAGSIVTLE